MKTAILLVNLGTPDAATAPAVRRYLREFLWDPRVVEIPRAVWWLVLHAFILPFRPKRSAAKYAMVWTPEGSPLKVFTERQAKLLRGLLGHRGRPATVEYAMRYGSPAVGDVLDRLVAAGCDRVLVLPLYPQYSAATTASTIDAVGAWAAKRRDLPELRFVKDYHDDPVYIDALAARVRHGWNGAGREADVHLVLSFHGIPSRSIRLGDPYAAQCERTARLLAARLGLADDRWTCSFQSRFGRAEWLKPYTAEVLADLARRKVGRVAVFCPGFPADCLETLEEIGIEGKQAFLAAGGAHYASIPCLNDDPAWIAALADLATRHTTGWT